MKLIDKNKNWQKICAGEDYCHPDFNQVITGVLNSLPSFHRKQWEFAVIYLNLLQAGKLNSDSIGASFGAGREPLIYIITQLVKSFTATDLYIYNTGWTTAKIDKNLSCLDFVLDLAPEDFPADKLDVKEMDMRQLEMSDSSLDFCYSSCAFEHIGVHEDFVKHLTEVKRVLKNDGIYVMTTEHLFMHDTMPIKGNYKFSIEGLLSIFNDADFYPNSELDNSLALSHLNKPRPELTALEGITNEMLNLFPGLILQKKGMPYTSSCLVFKKSNKKENFYLKESNESVIKSFFSKHSTRTLVETYKKYCTLDPIARLRKDVRSDMSDHLEYLVDNHEEYFGEMKVNSNNFAFTEFIYFDNFSFKFNVNIELFETQKITFKLLEMDQLTNKRKLVETVTLKFSENRSINFEHKAQSNKVYAVSIAQNNKKDVVLKNLTIRVKLIDI